MKTGIKKINKINNLFVVAFCSVLGLAATAQSLEDAVILDAKEQYLRNFDLSDPALTFKQVGQGTTPTNWGIKKDGKYIANLKCTAGNTYAPSAAAVYVMGRALDFNIYPVAVNRRVDISVNGVSLAGKSCVLKEWSNNFTQAFWNEGHLSSGTGGNKYNTRLLQVIRNCSADYADAEEYYYSANSSYGDPKINDAKTQYWGRETLGKAARDFANMLTIDVLIGNDDRLPGGNVHFRSTATQNLVSIQSNSVVYAAPRLFSLDNEAAFKTLAGSNALSDYKYVKRFDPEMMQKLKVLKQRLQQNDPALAALNFSLLKKSGMTAREAVIRHIDIVLDRAEDSSSCSF